MTIQNSVKNSSKSNDLTLFDAKKIAKSMLESLKEKSFRDELGFFNTFIYIKKVYGTYFRLEISTFYPDVGHFEPEAAEFYESENLKLIIKIKNEVQWLIIKQSGKTLFKFCFFMLGVIAILKLIC